ncbi:MAG TPA: ferredoxin reductase family protein [Kineosporiaceae bacterium]
MSGPIGITSTGSVGVVPSTDALRRVRPADAPNRRVPLSGPFSLVAPLDETVRTKIVPTDTSASWGPSHASARAGWADRAWATVRAWGRPLHRTKGHHRTDGPRRAKRHHRTEGPGRTRPLRPLRETFPARDRTSTGDHQAPDANPLFESRRATPDRFLPPAAAAAPATRSGAERAEPADTASARPAWARAPWWRTAAAAAVLASLGAVVALWLAGGAAGDLLGLGTMADVGEGVVSIGRLAGLVATDLLLVQVLLMARIPVVERAFGQADLTRRHRALGATSFTALLLHIALLTLGESLHSGLGPLGQFLQFVQDYPGVLLASAGAAILALVVLTSRTLRNRLRYEVWRAVHVWSYAGVALVVPHQLLVGRDFGTLPLARLYWWTLAGATLAAVLAWRVLRPLRLNLRHRLVVEDVVVESPDVVSIHLAGRDLEALGAVAGQFFTWRFRHGRWGWLRRHPFSLSAAPTADRLRITVKDVGAGTHWVSSVTPGTRVMFDGPFGRLHAGVRTRQQVTLIAAGIGITPLRALLEDLDTRPGDLTLIYRITSAEEAVFEAELRRLAATREAAVHVLVGPRRVLRRGASWLPAAAGSVSDVEALRLLAPGIIEHDVYVCGPEAWLDALLACLHRTGVPAAQIHTERFTWSDPHQPHPALPLRLLRLLHLLRRVAQPPARLSGRALDPPMRQARRASWWFLRAARPTR